MRWLDGCFTRDSPSLTVKARGVARTWHGSGAARVMTSADGPGHSCHSVAVAEGRGQDAIVSQPHGQRAGAEDGKLCRS
jgi:hypothetical protein